MHGGGKHGPTDGQQAGRKRWDGECGDESEQERSRTGGSAGRREQLAPCPSAGAGARRQAVEAELRRGRCGGGADAEAPQAFKEGASTLRNAQNRIHISCSAAAWGLGGGATSTRLRWLRWRRGALPVHAAG
jgi:hypothetical protein